MTGEDVAAIARAVSVPPWTFTTLVSAQPEADDGFALDATAARWRLALRRVRFPAEDAHCAFLVRFPTGNARCGLNELRPAACRLFPLEGGIESCTCDWTGVANDDASAEELERLASERDRYAIVVKAWNTYVVESGHATFTHADFCRFILDTYGERGP